MVSLQKSTLKKTQSRWPGYAGRRRRRRRKKNRRKKRRKK
jgi:hypothetical protein